MPFLQSGSVVTETPIYDRLAFEMQYDREWKLQWMEAVAATYEVLPPPKASDLFPFLKKW